MAEASRLERAAAALMAVATAGLLLAWPGWRMRDAPPGDGYARNVDQFAAAVEAFAAAHTVGERDGVPLVRPPPGAEVPVLARRFQFWPALQLQAGQTYRLHLAAQDTVHSVVIDGRELALLPGQVRVMAITPAQGTAPALQCGEYCGLGHNRMRGGIEVVP
ncbi:MAG TPA: quinol oxidase [Magnetospirillum sp.]|nr:quinol oxidase [Magnetospirillum sp.]